MAATEKTPVTMTDGRVVEFGSKQKVVKNSTINEQSGTITTVCDFRNGETRTYTSKPEMVLRFAAHGQEQKLGDILAGEDTLEDGIASFDDLVARLDKGEWVARRSKGEFTGSSMLIKALVEATGKTLEEIKTFLADKTAQEKTAMRRSNALKPIIDRMEAEKGKAAGVDADALLAGLGLDSGKKKAA